MGYINDFLRMIIEGINAVVNNYAISIIFFTIIVKLCLMPLDYKQRVSMKKMADIGPKIKELEKKYKGDPQKLQQKQQEMYKKEKINPLSGCLPLLVSMPILFAMFSVLRAVAAEQTVEMMNAFEQGKEYIPQGFLWIKNIWQPDSFMASILPTLDNLKSFAPISGSPVLTADTVNHIKAFAETPVYTAMLTSHGAVTAYTFPLLFWTINVPQIMNGYFILPILAAASQFLQTKLTPTQGDPSGNSSMKMMMYFMPLFSLWLCSSYNASFALYWVVGNLIAIGQQLFFTWYFKQKEEKDKNKIEVLDP